eukprot:TRINITY_DN8803_c0_g2_i2.p1 TRINITY_DN8803_c0_g2~~TRINITY_DN8803_c0_g2_i2.p1  ORF type:complete len:116 (+),score=7.94 TRINITY_DN8803_c0_g2_i2:147-494(+)
MFAFGIAFKMYGYLSFNYPKLSGNILYNSENILVKSPSINAFVSGFSGLVVGTIYYNTFQEAKFAYKLILRNSIACGTFSTLLLPGLYYYSILKQSYGWVCDRDLITSYAMEDNL